MPGRNGLKEPKSAKCLIGTGDVSPGRLKREEFPHRRIVSWDEVGGRTLFPYPRELTLDL